MPTVDGLARHLRLRIAGTRVHPFQQAAVAGMAGADAGELSYGGLSSDLGGNGVAEHGRAK